ncbi:hypothetical protein [Ferruginibacter sp. HRS2-29]|uniref:hypothetical protein n=1 Tax=Ferruginibacter sp. HRS2-29 TaxID=2487334 RepID=UPI0020CED052|nr:hypothetical protein [Ferruginibacter sp. HRS2-29]MCP9750046.1 hypothetical protein [Ferruginibacter sp. HRS2-29]
MYNFVFWFFYKFFEWRKGFKSIFLSAAMVGLTVLIHLLLLYAVIRYFTNTTLGKLNGSYTDRKLLYSPFVIGIFLIVYFFYYRRKSEVVLNKKENDRFSRPINIFYIILILVVPLLLAILFTNKALNQ